MRLFLALCFSAALSACATGDPEVSSEAALVERGYAYAEANCASCHAIEGEGRYALYPVAPSFEEIANTPGMSRRALNVWLHSPHPSMPMLIVEPAEIDALAAYIASLED